MGISDFFKDVVTLGGHSTLQEVQGEYTNYKDIYEELSLDFNGKQIRLKKLIRDVIKIRTKTLKTIKKAKNVLKKISIRDREKLNVEFNDENDYSFDQIEKIVTMDEISYEKLGNNILENTLTSLTLFDDMWELKLFDGLSDKDSLKLEAAVAVATAAITAVVNVVGFNLKTRKKISTYREQIVILLEAITVLKRENFKYDLVITRLVEIFASLEKSLQAFEFIYNDVSKTVNPHGIISVLLRGLQNKEKNRHSDEQLEKINKMIGSISSILKMLDTLPAMNVIISDAKEIMDKEYQEEEKDG